MQAYFSEYYRPTEAEFAELWETCVFAFDANVLLNFYRYGQATRDDLFRIMDLLKDRIWLPHQVAHEYHVRRAEVISEQADAYDAAMQSLADVDSSTREAVDKIRQKYPRHAGLDLDELTVAAKEVSNKLKGVVQAAKAAHPDYLKQDTVLERLTTLFADKVGPPYEQERLSVIHNEAKERYARKQPPGFEDKGKPEPNRYGDVVLWFQLLDRAKAQKIPIVFVTDDNKSDWWYRTHGKTIGPARELIREMRAIADVPFYMYSQQQFIEYARHLGVEVEGETVEEVREVGPLQLAQVEQSLRPVHDWWMARPEMEAMVRELGFDAGAPFISSLTRLRELIQERGDRSEFDGIVELWPMIISIIRSHSRRIDALLQSAVPVTIQDGILVLGTKYEFHRDGLNKRDTQRVIEEAVYRITGHPYSIRAEVFSELRRAGSQDDSVPWD